MKKWLKFFGLSFFSDKVAREAKNFGYGGSLLSIVLAFLFFMFGFIGASVVPFNSHLNKASEFNTMLERAFDDGFVLSLESNSLKVGEKAQTPAKTKAVNTYLDKSDADKYCVGDYHLIIDSRPMDMLIKFSQYAEDSDGNKISYEEYKKLSASLKNAYSLKTEYTDDQLILTDDLINSYIGFLEKDENGAKSYAELKNKISELSEEEYNGEVYSLYVRYYYSGVSSVLNIDSAPVLHDFYYNTYLLNGENIKFCYFFEKVCYGSFITDGGVYANYGGYYNVDDGVFANGATVAGLIKNVFRSSTGYVWLSFLMNSLVPFIILIVLLLFVSLSLFALGKIGNLQQFDLKFGDCYKTVASFVWITALATGLLTFILGFFVTAGKYYPYMYAVFVAILLVRSAIYMFTLKRFASNSIETDGDVVADSSDEE